MKKIAGFYWSALFEYLSRLASGFQTGSVFRTQGLFYLIILFSFLIFGQNAEAFLTRDLQLGSRGGDVLELQKFLNRSGALLSSIGPGSPGQETAFFGQLTKQAVIRYQELHQADILAPIGLSTGTGYVGRLTRARINLSANNASNTSVAEIGTLPPANMPEPKVFVTEPMNQKRTKESTPKPTSDQDLGLKAGLVPGFSLPSPPTLSPTMSLSSVSPSAGRPGEAITIYGEGFDAQNNTVYTGSEVLLAVPSVDGQSLSVTIKNPFADEYDTGGFNLPLHLYVENNTGISNPLIFNLILD